MHFQQEPVELTYTYNGKISNLKLFNKILYARQRYFFPLGCKILLEVLKNWLRYRCWHGGNLCRFEPYKSSHAPVIKKAKYSLEAQVGLNPTR